MTENPQINLTLINAAHFNVAHANRHCDIMQINQSLLSEENKKCNIQSD